MYNDNNNIYNSINNLYNMDGQNWTEVLANLYNKLTEFNSEISLLRNNKGSIIVPKNSTEFSIQFSAPTLSQSDYSIAISLSWFSKYRIKEKNYNYAIVEFDTPSPDNAYMDYIIL